MNSIIRYKPKNLIAKSSKLLNYQIIISTRLNSANSSNSQTIDASKSTKTSTHDYYDIVICGGGMVGNAMAAALGQDNIFKNLKVALIESMPKGKIYQLPSYHSNRVCALNEQTIDFFKRVDCFDFIEKNRYGTAKYMHVWDAKSDASISFQNPDGSNLALIIENDLIQESLARRLPESKNLDVLYQSKISDFDYNDQFVDLKLNNNRLVKTKLLIGSDGANSIIREKAKLATIKWNYDQIAIVATLKLSEKAPNFTAWQRFLPTGPLALLPLNDEYSSLVWSIKKNLAEELLKVDDEQFAHRVNQAFTDEGYTNESARKLENIVQNSLDFIRKALPQAKDYIVDRGAVGRLLPPKIETCVEKSRASYPLSFLHSNHYVSNRIALIGDAIHKVHPLAGQGANLGFGDVVCLTKNLKENLESGGDIGSSLTLKNYESQRQLDAYIKVIGIDLLSKLYTDQDYGIQSPLVALRTIGLTLSNRIDPLKEFYKAQAIRK